MSVNSSVKNVTDSHLVCCVVCQEDIQENDNVKVAQLPACVHKFHLPCINGWTSSYAARNHCPICRREITHLIVDGGATPLANPALAVIAAHRAMIEAENRARAAGFQEVVVVRDFLNSLSETDRSELVVDAVENENFDTIYTLLESGPIGSAARGLALLAAYTEEDFDLAYFLLESGPIQEKDRGLAVLSGCRNEDLDWVRSLLASGRISTDDMQLALNRAGSNLDLRRVLLSAMPNEADPVSENSVSVTIVGRFVIVDLESDDDENISPQ